jgi:glycerophosphoryl diester phosphodiesterase
VLYPWVPCDHSPLPGPEASVIPITFAHRGARLEAPENTLEAFRRGLDQGASGLETDAWLAGDGEVVLVHDAVVRRGLKRRRVDGASAAELAELAEVPRLVDLYETLGTAYDLSIDVKDPAATEPIIEIARRYAAAGRLWLCTPDVALALRIAEIAPDVHAVHSTFKELVEAPLERHAATLGDRGIGAMNMHHTEWTAGLVALFHRFGVRAFAWDTQEERHIRAMLRIGIDGLYCDRPARLVRTVADAHPEADADLEAGADPEADAPER